MRASLGDALLRHNMALRIVAVAIAVVTALILFLPWAQRLLKFGSIAWGDMLFAVGLGICLLLLLEACKPRARRLMRQASPVRAGHLATAS